MKAEKYFFFSSFILHNSSFEKEVFLVILAAGVHPVPSRTRQLSPPAPMVLEGRPSGRVGHRQKDFFYFSPFWRVEKLAFLR